jgi:hypothetical protein
MEVKRKPIANSTASPLESLVKPVNGPAPPCTRHSQKKHHISNFHNGCPMVSHLDKHTDNIKTKFGSSHKLNILKFRKFIHQTCVTKP